MNQKVHVACTLNCLLKNEELQGHRQSGTCKCGIISEMVQDGVIVNLLLKITNRKWYIDLSNNLAAIPMTLSVTFKVNPNANDFTVRHYASAVYAVYTSSVCPSFRHIPVFYQNGYT